MISITPLSLGASYLGNPCECSHKPYIRLLETRVIVLHYAADSLCLASFKFFWWAPQDLFIFYLFLQKGRFSRSRSSKVDKFGANRKREYDFLLVRNSNVGPILHRFGDLTWFYVLLTPPLFNPNFGGVPVAPDRPYWASTSTWALSYSAVKLFSKNSNLFEHGTWSLQTDGQTDRQTDDLLSHNCALR